MLCSPPFIFIYHLFFLTTCAQTSDGMLVLVCWFLAEKFPPTPSTPSLPGPGEPPWLPPPNPDLLAKVMFRVAKGLSHPGDSCLALATSGLSFT